MSKLNKAQKICRKNYASGDFNYCASAEEARDIGDSLFGFLMTELSDEEDCIGRDTALARMANVVREVSEVQVALIKLV